MTYDSQNAITDDTLMHETYPWEKNLIKLQSCDALGVTESRHEIVTQIPHWMPNEDEKNSCTLNPLTGCIHVIVNDVSIIYVHGYINCNQNATEYGNVIKVQRGMIFEHLPMISM